MNRKGFNTQTLIEFPDRLQTSVLEEYKGNDVNQNTLTPNNVDYSFEPLTCITSHKVAINPPEASSSMAKFVKANSVMKGTSTPLKQLRKDAGFTQKELALRIGVCRETVVAIENEHRKTIDTLEVITIRRWWKACRHSATTQTRISFKALIYRIFNL